MLRSSISTVVLWALLMSSPRVQAGESKLVANPVPLTLSLPEEKSPMVARLYSWVPTLTLSLLGLAVIDEGGGFGSGTWGTRAGYGLLVLGVGVGPSGGQLYAGESHHILSRTALCGLSLLLWLVVSGEDKESGGGDSGDSDHRSGDGFAGAILMGGLALAITIWTLSLAHKDLWDAPDAARRANWKAANLSLAPVLLRSEGTAHWGLGLAGQF